MQAQATPAAEAPAAAPLRPTGALARQVAEACGVNAGACYGCQKCSNGCPLAFAMDLRPYQVVRYVQMGQAQRLLDCDTIWLCASCHTCVTRCPNGVDLPRLMDHLKQTVVSQGRAVGQGRALAFHRAFLAEIMQRGRVFEGGLMMRYFLATGGLTGPEARRNARLGWAMFRRGRLKLLPARVRRRAWLKALRRGRKERAS